MMVQGFLDARLRVLVTLLAFLSGCSVTPPRAPPAADPQVLWEQRALQLQGLEDWRFSGRAAVSGPEITSRSIRVHWVQQREDYGIAFMSLLGQRVAEIQGGGGGAVLLMPGEEPMHAASSRELIAAVLGWTAPVEDLRYWVLGLPRAASAVDLDQLDPWGRLVGFEQGDWQVEITRYADLDGLELPTRLTLSHPEIRIRIIIDEWNLEQGDATD